MIAVDLESLPPDLRAEIEALQKAPEPLFPIAPREHALHFSTKEIKELGDKVDLLIRAVNLLAKPEEPDGEPNPKPKKR